jgi:hypothetical protein
MSANGEERPAPSSHYVNRFETSQNTTHFGTTAGDLPAAVTPTSAAKRNSRRQKVRKSLVFLDWQAI